LGGKRCLVISAKGQTTSRMRNGAVLHRFSSGLPSGNTAKFSINNPNHYCILDCVFHESSLTYYVLDIQCWRGNLYYDCDTSFRLAPRHLTDVSLDHWQRHLPHMLFYSFASAGTTGCIRSWASRTVWALSPDTTSSVSHPSRSSTLR
jgi:hypothetical protein